MLHPYRPPVLPGKMIGSRRNFTQNAPRERGPEDIWWTCVGCCIRTFGSQLVLTSQMKTPKSESKTSCLPCAMASSPVPIGRSVVESSPVASPSNDAASGAADATDSRCYFCMRLSSSHRGQSRGVDRKELALILEKAIALIEEDISFSFEDDETLDAAPPSLEQRQ